MMVLDAAKSSASLVPSLFCSLKTGITTRFIVAIGQIAYCVSLLLVVIPPLYTFRWASAAAPPMRIKIISTLQLRSPTIAPADLQILSRRCNPILGATFSAKFRCSRRFCYLFALKAHSSSSNSNQKGQFDTNSGIGSAPAKRTARELSADDWGLVEAAKLLQQGRLVAFPTETVYGLGAHALNTTALEAIFAAKRRPMSDPLIVHVGDISQMYELFDFSTPKAKVVVESLCAAFWPGPLTVIHRASNCVPSIVTAGTGRVGVRSPRHSVARRLLSLAAVPVAAPSANRFGHVSPTCSAHVWEDLGDKDINILEDSTEISGGCSIGVESTVCAVSDDGSEVTVLRCGAVTTSAIKTVMQHAPSVNHLVEVIIKNEQHLIPEKSTFMDRKVATPKEVIRKTGAIAPGQMLRHYSPDIPTAIVAEYRDGCDVKNAPRLSVESAMVIDFAGRLIRFKDQCAVYTDLSPSGNTRLACMKLFSTLRRAEAPEMRDAGVKHLLLPDLADAASAAIDSAADHAKSFTNSDGSGTATSASVLDELSTLDFNGGVTVLQDINSNGDLEEKIELENAEMVIALWERIHRAASGSYMTL